MCQFSRWDIIVTISVIREAAMRLAHVHGCQVCRHKIEFEGVDGLHVSHLLFFLLRSRDALFVCLFYTSRSKYSCPKCMRSHSDRVAFHRYGSLLPHLKVQSVHFSERNVTSAHANDLVRCRIDGTNLNEIMLCRVDINVLDKSCGGTKEDAFDLHACATKMAEEEALYRQEFGLFMSRGHT
jgi:hypothetical protein